MLIKEGKICFYCFLITSVLIFLLSTPEFFFDFVPKEWGSVFWGPVLYYALLNMILRFYFKADNEYQVAVRASFLGFIFATGTFIFWYAPDNYKSFGIYGVVMGTFHCTEYLGIAWSNPRSLSTDSFILNHSTHYLLAALFSWMEFFFEAYFFPEIKEYKLIWLIGFLICMAGECLRKLAMITAHTNFTHVVRKLAIRFPIINRLFSPDQVQFVRAHEHNLVTHGVYSVMRHPSYVGWFWWSIGTQIILANPICTIMYTVVSWIFFRDRVFIEEIALCNFFGNDYVEYQKNVPTGLPYIEGYKQQL